MSGVDYARQHVAGHDRRTVEGQDCMRCGVDITRTSDPTAFCNACIYIAADEMAEALVELFGAVERWHNSMRSKLMHARCGTTEVALSKTMTALLRTTTPRPGESG